MSKKDFSAKALAALLAKGKPEEAEQIIADFLVAAIAADLAETTTASKTEIERLSGELTTANSSISALNGQIDTLKSQLASTPSDTTIAILTQERDAALEMVKDMSEQIALQSQIKDPNKVVVSIGGEKFFLQGGNFNVPGFGKLSLDELSKNEGALQVMKDRNSGALTPIEK